MRKIIVPLALIACACIALVAVSHQYFSLGRQLAQQEGKRVHDTFALSVVTEESNVPVVRYPSGEEFYSCQVGRFGDILITRNIANPGLFTVYNVQENGHLVVRMRFNSDPLR